VSGKMGTKICPLFTEAHEKRRINVVFVIVTSKVYFLFSDCMHGGAVPDKVINMFCYIQVNITRYMWHRTVKKTVICWFISIFILVRERSKKKGKMLSSQNVPFESEFLFLSEGGWDRFCYSDLISGKIPFFEDDI
jgi:hypothetical protein